MSAHPDPLHHRVPDHAIESLFLRRWSPRAMTGKPLATATLMRLLEAARWAPSTYNVQEWRFLYALHGGEHWQRFHGLLSEGNKGWCANAGALLLVASVGVFRDKEGRDNPVHAFDAGLATQNLLLQAAALGLVAHAMAGFDRDAARRELALPADVHPQAMVAVGWPGDPDDLPENRREQDMKPSSRNPVGEFAFHGLYPTGR